MSSTVVDVSEPIYRVLFIPRDDPGKRRHVNFVNSDSEHEVRTVYSQCGEVIRVTKFFYRDGEKFYL